MKRVGTIQGRLSLPVNGHIQEFPNDWQAEFSLLDDYGLSHIEWLITEGSEQRNPAFDEEVNLSGYSISSFCADTLVSPHIIERKFLEEKLTPICTAAMRNNIGWITIPLLEDSNVEDPPRRRKFKNLIKEYAKRYPDLNFSFECELSIDGLHDILSLSDSFYVTYDTGNITSYGVDHQKYIDAFHDKISNVHLKDRTYDARTVPPGTGATDFKAIFRKLKSVGYDKIYTLQTCRGADGNEINNTLEHKYILEGFYNEE